MPVILLLLGLPVFFAILTFFLKTQKALEIIIRLAAACIIVATVICVVIYYQNIYILDLSGYPYIQYIMLGIEILISIYIIYIGIRKRSLPVVLLSALQALLLVGFELFGEHGERVNRSIYIDKLSLVMIIIVGVIGSMICVYAAGYMKEYHQHRPELKDRRSMFLTVLLVFISAMFGLVISNDLTYMLFFWEITSLCSFLLIGYSQTPEAVKNSLDAITINVFGGLCFTIGIVMLSTFEGVLDLYSITHLDSDSPLVMSAVFLIVCAGLTKSAQLPFSKWLLGAMVAPTPTSAMLHSSTMVKAGVYIIIRLAPMLGRNAVGMSVTLVGGITFFIAAVLAVSQSDAKKILAYSTISNLGLIVACAGLNTPASQWAAVMLIIFHAIAKSLLFLSVGSAEHQLGSRSVEQMEGLYEVSRRLTMLLVIGIAGMFVAPFGMLISKWAAMKAFVDSGNMLVVLIIAFGSTVTLFYWTKWMGKLIAHSHRFAKTDKSPMRMDQKVSLYTIAAMVIVVCMIHPVVSNVFIVPYVNDCMMTDFTSPISTPATSVILLMLCMLFIVPLVLIPYFTKHRVKPTSLYLSGVNTGDDMSFKGSMGQPRKFELRNWYMTAFLNETRFLQAGYVICAIIIIGGFFIAMGGAFL